VLEFDTLNINLGLDRMRKILSALGDPQLKFKSIHVAGTNGKGSVCAMLDSILRESGYKVGLFTSPHLFRWEERIKIGGEEIRNAECVMRNAEIEKTAEDLKIKLTPFEAITAVAFKYFSDQGVDIAVVEVGMGGRLDATNVITPLVSVITNIDLDHTEYLGDTIEKIAFEKAGIIKKGVPVVTAEKKAKALKVIKNICKENEARCWVLGKEAGLPAGQAGLEVRSKLLGAYQKGNEAAAVKTAELLGIKKPIINKGLKKTAWPGRFQILSRNPLVVVDGAHNPAGAAALAGSIKEMKIKKPRTLVLGFQGYKNIKEIIEVIVPLADKIIVTRSTHPQAAKPGEICSKISNKKTLIINSVPEAIKVALGDNRPVIIAGSLFVAAEAIESFDAHKR